MPDDRQRLAMLQERDRQTIERAGLGAVRALAMTTRIRVLRAWEISGSPQLVSKALSDSMLGNAMLDHGGLVPVLAKGMLAADLRGRYRTQLTAAAGGADPSKLQLSATAAQVSMVALWRAGGSCEVASGPMQLSSSALKDAVEFLKTRMKLKGTQLDAIEKKYRTDAIRVMEGVKVSVEKRLQKAILEAAQRGLGVKKGTQLLRKAFDEAGLAPGNQWQLETMFRTETQKAYSAGRWSTLQDPDVADIIKGLEYVAIEDERTTPLCEKLDGMIRPLDDPIWKRFFPPNHYNCRSSTIEVIKGEGRRLSKVPDLKGIEVDRDFAVNFGTVFGDMLKRAG